MAKEKICECFDRWGEYSEDCTWSFKPDHWSQLYCPACRPVAKRARVRQAVKKFRGDKSIDALVESTDREWLASWIDKVCTCCGRKGVPTFNRFLCYQCWKDNAGDVTYELPDVYIDKERQNNWKQDEYAPTEQPVCRVYSSRFMSQADLKRLVPSENS